MNTDPAILLGLRPRMMSVAYRMLGSVTDAEDAVQDAFVRLQTAEDVTSTEGFLIRTTTRLCIDRLRADRRHKEYVGPWVPEPVETRTGSRNAAMAESLTQAFLLMLERLSPDERAVFLPRTVFDYEFAEIAEVAEVVGKSEVHVRQIVSRARQRLERDESRFHPAPHEASGLAERFVAACRVGTRGQSSSYSPRTWKSTPTAVARWQRRVSWFAGATGPHDSWPGCSARSMAIARCTRPRSTASRVWCSRTAAP